MFPAAVPETQTLQQATDLPPLSSLAGTLINELNEIDQYFILVLDDYHMIHEKAINDLIIQHCRMNIIRSGNPNFLSSFSAKIAQGYEVKFLNAQIYPDF